MWTAPGLGKPKPSVCTARAMPATINAQPSRSCQPAWRTCAESCMGDSALDGSRKSGGYAHDRGSAAPLLGTIRQAVWRRKARAAIRDASRQYEGWSKNVNEKL